MSVSDHVRLDAQLQQHIANHDLIGQMILDHQDAACRRKRCILAHVVRGVGNKMLGLQRAATDSPKLAPANGPTDQCRL
ncbi:hypothetical protein FQZ97_952620 [compost metagenome]